VLGSLPVSRLRGQSVVKPLLPGLAGFLPQAVRSIALKNGHRDGGVMAPRRRAQCARALTPFRLEIMHS
jgi:hypothetical protein